MRRHPLLLSVAAVAVALLAVTSWPPSARADGEAGVVVVWGDGTTSSYCVAFEGDSIGGADLLADAGLATNELSGLVCSIDDVGCSHSGSFNSCLCQCQTGSPDCIYWSFFTRDYGQPWRYSSTGFRGTSLANGDLHGWQWLPASSVAPPGPPSVTFEDVCGHPPLAPAQPSPVSTIPPGSTPPLSNTPTAAGATATSSAVPVSPSPVATGRPRATLVAETPTPAPPEAGDSEGSAGSASGAWIRFGVVATVLLFGIGAMLVLRARHAH